MNAEAYNSFSTVGSDHRIVCAKLKLSLRVSKHIRKTRYDWKIFSNSPDIQANYTVIVKNRFQVLEEEGKTGYSGFVEANRLAMEDCVPAKPKKSTAYTSSEPRVVEARENATEAHEAWIDNNTDENKAAWKLALSRLHETYSQVKEEELEAHTKAIESAYGAMQYGEAWKAVNQMSGRKRAKEGQVSGSSPEERLTTWFTHFQKLLGEPPAVEDPDEDIPNVYDCEELEINDEPFTISEFRRVKSSLQLGKAAGPDGIPTEVLKSCDFDEICLNF